MGGGHFGLAKTMSKLRNFDWRGKLRDLAKWVQACMECQKRRKQGPTSNPHLHPIRHTTVLGQMAVDLCGPMSITARGNRYIVNFVDTFTNYVISVPAPDSKASTISKILVNDVVTKFGAPRELLSDNATNFTAEGFRNLCEELNIRKVYCTPHHSQWNGMVERSFRMWRDVIAMLTQEKGADFDELLSSAAFYYNSSVNPMMGESPFHMMFGRDPILPADQLLYPTEPPKEMEIGDYKEDMMKHLDEVWKRASDVSWRNSLRMSEIHD